MNSHKHPSPCLGTAIRLGPNRFASCLLLLATLLGISSPTKNLWAQNSLTAPRQPNIILMMADDLGWGDTGFQGHPRVNTPHLDSMAANGLVFRQFYASAPVCSPTRAAVLTGRHPHRYGIDHANVGHLPAEEFQLAKLLKQHGYTTGHFGKWHLGTMTQTQRDANRGGKRNLEHFAPPQHRSFDRCFSTESKVPTWDPLLKPLDAGNNWWNALAPSTPSKPYGTAYWNEQGNPVAGPLRGDDSKLIVDQALKFVHDAADRKQPFLAVIWFHAPHLPVVAGNEDRDAYADQSPFAQHYLGCITALDRSVGELRHTLRELNIEDDTLLAFCSDNGPEGRWLPQNEDQGNPGSSGGLRGRKRDLFEGGIRVPGIMEWPGVIPQATTNHVGSTIDYVPTILEVLDLPTPNVELDGESLVAAWKDPTGQRTRPLMFYFQGRRAMIDPPWKWIHYREGLSEGNTGQRLQQSQDWLFRLDDDPHESNNLIATQKQRATEMQAAYRDWLKQANQDRQSHGLNALNK